MKENKSNFKDNLITTLLVFTFAIPIIPIGLYYGYDYLFGTHETKSAPVSNYEETTNAKNDDNQTPTSSNFGGYDCSSDCSGHEAGYNWAEENDVCDESFDGGNSESFAEGVRSYAEDNCSSSAEYEDYDYYR